MIVVEVKREPNESSGSLMRRFSKRVSAASILRRAKRAQAALRPQSYFKRKKSALKRLAKKLLRDRLIKLGKLPNVQTFRRH